MCRLCTILETYILFDHLVYLTHVWLHGNRDFLHFHKYSKLFLLKVSILGFCCSAHTRWTVSRSAKKMSFCAKTMLTASPNDGAAMTCLIAWTTAMRKTVVMVWICTYLWSHFSLGNTYSLLTMTMASLNSQFTAYNS